MTRRLVLAFPGEGAEDLNARTGGYGYDRRLVEHLGRRGWRVDLMGLGRGFPDPGPEVMTGAAAAFAALPDGALALVDGLAGGVLPGVFERERERLRIVALCHHPLALETGTTAERAAALAALERRSLAAARAVIVTSRVTAEILAADFGVPARKVTVALPGTDARPPAVCAGDPPVLLTVGSLIRRKGHDILIEALARIADLRWTSRIVGGDGYDRQWASALSKQAARAGLANRIRFVGEVDDPTPEYAQADLFVLPSRYEGYGMAFAEALAHGLPVVAARAGAVPQVVPEDAGALAPPDDPAAIADALRILLTNPAAHARARAAAHHAGRALPTFDDTAATVEEVLDVALRLGQTPRHGE